jgi:cytochrome c peroxidase
MDGQFSKFFTTMTLISLPACGLEMPSSDQSPTPVAPNPLPVAVTSVLNLPDTPYAYDSPALPAHFRTPLVMAQDNTPANNPITKDGATLGRVLFYDKNLSANRSVACASCHDQSHGFSDTVKFSPGFAGAPTARNSMPLSNARYYRSGKFFWDERAATLEAQVLLPIQSTVEMGLTLAEIVPRVAAQAYYPELFTRAFGTAEVTTDRVSKALAQFVRSIVSYRSRYDEGVAATGAIGASFANFTDQENRGKALFLGPAGCAGCHLVNPPPAGPPSMTLGNQAAFFINIATNNGLTAGLTTDNGVGDVTGLAMDQGRFKAPELRNVALTAPYMHDGSIATLAEVIEHYNTGVLAHPNLDPRLRVPGTMTPRKLNLTPADSAALVAFLGTLTDQPLTQDPAFSNPFRSGGK